ncbi:GGDEF domain-containing protein [Roseomonas sp. E05]|uniref:GGDEF domain-containing protein n=1 Tax=Roseomonas sp. E05 TaxID=3046310 RepID=UPI0024BA319B|nr:GGDEF domain-containing protein [Roseomonas sp. E05]MDJ0389952.1 GGDEF domain-containing protein [Roseomonas sp. E05]
MDEILERRRRLVVNLLHAAGAATVAALWAFESSAGLITDLDRYAYPVLLLVLGVGFGVRWLRPRHRVMAELGAYGVFAGYFITAILSFLILQPDNRVYTVANTLQWMPVIYLAAFFFFPRRLAVMASWSVFALALLVPVAALLWGNLASWDGALISLLANAYVVHLLTLACLSLLALFGTRYEHVQRRARALESAVLTDPLTGVANRRGLERALESLNQTPGRLVGLILLDTDHFKAVNDRFGHIIGDEVLADLGQRLSARLRRGDILGRWGGEEFLLITPDTIQMTAMGIAERMRAIAREVPHPAVGTITVSAGVAVWMSGTPVQEALHRADMALYAAKAQGRNRVEAG